MSINQPDQIQPSRRRFFRWIRKCAPQWESDYTQALLFFREALESKGFSWRSVDFIGDKLKANELWFERVVPHDEIDCICIRFDSDSPLSFAIYGIRKIHNPDYPEHVRRGDLVRRRSDSYYSSKLFGPRWWHPVKRHIFHNSVKRAGALLPQLIEFLETGLDHRNVWSSSSV